METDISGVEDITLIPWGAKKVIEQYIRNQLQQDYEEEQLSIKEFVDPFTGQPVKEGK